MRGGSEPSVTAPIPCAYEDNHLSTLNSVTETMTVEPVVLEGRLVRLEPLRMDHLAALTEVAISPAVWRWMPVRMESEADLRVWIEQSLEQAAVGKALPWVTW